MPDYRSSKVMTWLRKLWCRVWGLHDMDGGYWCIRCGTPLEHLIKGYSNELDSPQMQSNPTTTVTWGNEMANAKCVRVDGKSPQMQSNVGVAGGDDDWLSREAKRRGCSESQVARDAFRAYRKLVPDSEEYKGTAPNYTPVSF